MKNILIIVLLLFTLFSSAQNIITKGEYWFDNDLAQKKALNFTAEPNKLLTINLQVDDLYDGLHTVNFRFLDDSSKWSSVVSSFFIKKTLKSGSSSVELTSYEYWFDSDYQFRTQKAVTQNGTFSLLDNLNVRDLYNGLHTVHFRFKDSQSAWSSVVSKFFIKTQKGEVSTINELSGFEYWFDTSHDTRKWVDMGDAETMVINDNIDVANLFNGLHTIHYRFKDSKGLWSSVISKFFIKTQTGNESTINELSGFEYWFDTHADSRNWIAILDPKTFSLNDNVDVTNLFNGLHTIHYRFKDSQGLWSSVISKFFVKSELNQSLGDVVLTGLEYWFDNDLSNLTQVSISKENYVDYLENLDVSYLHNGLHTVHYRFIDSRGLFSSAVSRFFVKQNNEVKIQDNNIVACRYWFNDSVMHYIDFKNEARVLEFQDSLSMLHYSKGEYIVNMQFKDVNGVWSSTVSDTVLKHSFPYAELHAEKMLACEGDSIQFSALFVDVDSVAWDFDDGVFSNDPEPRHKFAENNDFNVNVEVFDSSLNVSQTYWLDSLISVYALPQINLADSILLINSQTEILDAGAGFSTYIWNGELGSSELSISGSDFTPGLHEIWVKVSNEFGCENSDTIRIRVKSTSGISAASSVDLLLYPNPTTRYIFFKYDNLNLERFNCEVLDLSGKVLVSKTIMDSTDGIDVSTFKPGQYILKLYLKNHLEMVKFIKL